MKMKLTEIPVAQLYVYASKWHKRRESYRPYSKNWRKCSRRFKRAMKELKRRDVA